MMKIGLETVVKELPDKIFKDVDYNYLLPFIPQEMKKVFRFPKENRRLENEDAAEIMAANVTKKALDKAGLKPSDIDLIIANNTGGKYMCPMVGCYLHHEVGFQRETMVLNIQNACASFTDGCWIAHNLIMSGLYKRILVLTVSAWSTSGAAGRIDKTDFTGSIMGDGAGAGIVSTQNLKCEFIAYYNRTFGELYNEVGMKLQGPKIPEMEEAKLQPAASNYLFTTEKFLEWWKQNGDSFGIDSINGALQKAKMKLSDIDTVIFHQPFDMLYDRWIEGAAKAGLSKEKWIHTWDKYGNLSSSGIPINLAEFWEEGKLKKNSIVVLLSIGAGMHMPTMIVRWLD